MRYFEELDAKLTAILLPLDDIEDEEEWFSRVKRQIGEIVLESYRNGQKAGPAPAKASADERPRNNGAQGFRSRFKRNRRD